jgi:hypothetical protein
MSHVVTPFSRAAKDFCCSPARAEDEHLTAVGHCVGHGLPFDFIRKTIPRVPRLHVSVPFISQDSFWTSFAHTTTFGRIVLTLT